MKTVVLKTSSSSFGLDRTSWGHVLMLCRRFGVRPRVRRFNARVAGKMAEAFGEAVYWLSSHLRTAPEVPIVGPIRHFAKGDNLKLFFNLGDFLLQAAEDDGFVVTWEVA